MNIDTIFQQAKEDMMRDGEHRPVLWVELAEGGINPVVFADFPFETTVQKQKALFDVARKLGCEHRHDELRQVVMVMEAWTAEYKPGEQRKYRFPSEDPNRKEHLVATVLDIPAPKKIEQSMYAAEIIRSGGGIDLLPHGKFEGKVTSQLLTAFLAGFYSAKLSDEEFGAILAKSLKK